MTLAITSTKQVHNGNGAASSFSFTFPINKAADLTVVKTSTAGVETTLTEGTGTTNYSVSVTSYPGTGSITYPATLGTLLATGEKITISRVLDLTQETDLQNQGSYKPEQVESTFDISRMIDQQLQEQVDRAIKSPISDTSGADYTIPAPSAGAYFKWNDAATALITSLIADASLADSVDETGTNTDKDKLVSNALAKSWNDWAAFLTSGQDGMFLGRSGGSPAYTVPGLPCDARISLLDGDPTPTADQASKGTIYVTPNHTGNRMALYDTANSVMRIVTFSQVSVLATTGTTSRPHDVFAYLNSGSLAVELHAWTNDTTRATAITLQNGFLCKSGDASRRFIGSCYIDSSDQVSDTAAIRNVWNLYNQIPRPMLVIDSADTWTYDLTSFQQARGQTSNQLEFVCGLDSSFVEANVTGHARHGTVGATNFVGIGLDSATVNSANINGYSATAAADETVQLNSGYSGYPGVGRHSLKWLERANGSGSTTWQGDGGTGGDRIQSGIKGLIFG